MAPLVSRKDIIARHEAVSFFVENPKLLSTIRTLLKSVPDIARALSRLALNRGGPRDIKAMARGFEIAGQIHLALAEKSELPDEISHANDSLRAISSELIALLDNALGDELPMKARDGGFVKSGFNEELDELRILRDESRQIIAQLQAQYGSQTKVKSLKIRHNNVLGYFIEVTALNAANLQSDELKGTFIHRQTLANVMRFTTTHLAELETKIANCGGSFLRN